MNEVLANFNLVVFNENEADKESESKPYRGRGFSQCLKILTPITIKKTRMDWMRFLTSCQRKLTSESFDNDNKLTLTSFFDIRSVF